MADDDVLYVIADTHLGLRERRGNQSADDPVMVADFLRWLARIPEAGVEIPTLGPAGIESRTLRPPTRLILLGDILELWDSENQTLLLSAASVIPSLAGLPSKVVYVLGNHDNILAISSGAYPFAAHTVELVPDTFPEPDAVGTIHPLHIGGDRYVFVHGHQLDRRFGSSRGAWRWLGHLRHIGAAMGSYAWVFSALALLTAVGLFTSAPVLAVFLLFVTLIVLVVPRGYMTLARPLYDLRGLRYRRDAAREGFQTWWSRFQHTLADPIGVAVVYGHTHVIDFFDFLAKDGAAVTSELLAGPAEIVSEVPVTPGQQAAYNISSWVSAKGGFETVTRATFLYADSRGPMFVGWDWKKSRPFHIPRALTNLRPIRRMSEAEAEIARSLLWPDALIDKWRQTDEKVRARVSIRRHRGGRPPPPRETRSKVASDRNVNMALRRGTTSASRGKARDGGPQTSEIGSQRD